MRPYDFVVAVYKFALAHAVDDVIALLANPPGRRPEADLLELAAWYRGLEDRDKKNVRRVSEMAVFTAAFGIMAILDGVRVIETSTRKGAFQLTFTKDGKSWDLILPEGEMLHDVLKRLEDEGVPEQP